MFLIPIDRLTPADLRHLGNNLIEEDHLEAANRSLRSVGETAAFDDDDIEPTGGVCIPA